MLKNKLAWASQLRPVFHDITLQPSSVLILERDPSRVGIYWQATAVQRYTVSIVTPVVDIHGLLFYSGNPSLLMLFEDWGEIVQADWYGISSSGAVVAPIITLHVPEDILESQIKG
jgi:hypothetical protein